MKYIAERFASKNGSKATNVFRLKGEDARLGIVRLPSQLIKTPNNPKGLFRRGQFVTLRNQDNGKIVVREVKGCGSQYRLYGCAVALDYDGLLELGLNTKETDPVNLVVSDSNWFAREYFLCYQDPDRSSREGRKNSWQAMILGLILSPFVGMALTAIL